MENLRDFLKKMAAVMAGITLPFSIQETMAGQKSRRKELLPVRKLGSTGETVTMLGVGGFHIHWTSERDAREVINTAMENGIRFFDTAESYGPHVSEIKYGKFLTRKHRDEIFLMTKSTAKDAKTAREHLEGSLRRLKTDYLDLWQVHALRNPEDVDNRIEEGILDVFQEAKESGKVRYIGFTGHQNPQAHLRMLERTKDMNIWDTVQMPINPVDAASNHSFIKDVLPVLIEREIAVLAMKTLADGRFFAKKNHFPNIKTDTPAIPDRFSIEEALNFAWSLPISTLITGAENKEFLEEKIKIARSFTEMKESEKEKIIEKVSNRSVYGELEYYKRV